MDKSLQLTLWGHPECYSYQQIHHHHHHHHQDNISSTNHTLTELSILVAELFSRCQTIDKVGQLLWAWFSHQRKLIDKIVEGDLHHLQLHMISASFTDTQQQNADHKIIHLHYFFWHLMNENKHYKVTNAINN